METAINNFQKNIFTLLLYASGLTNYLMDLAGGNRTPLLAFFDALILLLGWLSISYTRGGLAYIVLFILACIVVNLSYTPSSIFYALNGVREIVFILAMVMFYNKIFADGNEELTEEYIKIMKTYGFIYLIAQVPTSFIQYMQFGPGDMVGGTEGYLGSGMLTLAVICMVYFMSHFAMNVSMTVMLYICMIPLVLNETKISFILIPLTVVFMKFKPRLQNVAVAVVSAVTLFLLFNRFYAARYLDFDNSAKGIFTWDFLSDYLLSEDVYEDIPRLTKIILAWKLISQETHTLLFGVEYGMFRGGNVIEVSEFKRNYYWLLFGTRPYLFFLLLQGGLFLSIGITWLIVHINHYFRKLNKFKVYLFLMFLLIMVYTDAYRNQHFVTIYLFFVYFANWKNYSEKYITR